MNRLVKRSVAHSEQVVSQAFFHAGKPFAKNVVRATPEFTSFEMKSEQAGNDSIILPLKTKKRSLASFQQTLSRL